MATQGTTVCAVATLASFLEPNNILFLNFSNCFLSSIYPCLFLTRKGQGCITLKASVGQRGGGVVSTVTTPLQSSRSISVLLFCQHQCSLRAPPTGQRHFIREVGLIGDSNLPTSVNVSVSLC